MEIILIAIACFFAGWSSKGLFIEIGNQIKNKKIIDDIKSQYSQILENIKSKKASFKSRVHQTVYVSTDIKDYGTVELLYLMDKKDVAIFKDNKCIYSSHLLDTNIKNNLISSVRTSFNKEINDVVEIMGIVFSKAEFEKMFNRSADDILKQQDILKKLSEESKSDIQKIVESNSKKLDLDEILEKVGKVGYENLTQEEKDFLSKIK